MFTFFIFLFFFTININHFSVYGCTNTTLDCSGGFVILATALSVGLVAGMAALGAILGLALAGGGAVAAVNHKSSDQSSTVMANPLYEGGGKEVFNPIG